MPHNLALPSPLKKQGWRAKIREGERLEPPHVSFIRGTLTWRFDLRHARFLDRNPPVRRVPAPLLAHVLAHLEELRRAWDRMYPENPVGDDR